MWKIYKRIYFLLETLSENCFTVRERFLELTAWTDARCSIVIAGSLVVCLSSSARSRTSLTRHKYLTLLISIWLGMRRTKNNWIPYYNFKRIHSGRIWTKNGFIFTRKVGQCGTGMWLPWLLLSDSCCVSKITIDTVLELWELGL